MKTIAILLMTAAAVSCAKYEFSDPAKHCISEIKSDEDTVRTLVPEQGPFPEDNEVVQQFFGCIFRGFINDDNELVVDDKLVDYTTGLFAVRMGGKRKLAELVARDSLEHCKGVKGDSRGRTAVKLMNCLKDRFTEYTEE